MQTNWSVYIIRCSDDSLYTGITKDLPRRFQQHLTGKGAKYFRGRKPVAITYQLNGLSRQDAARQEYRIKQLSRVEKQRLANTGG